MNEKSNKKRCAILLRKALFTACILCLTTCTEDEHDYLYIVTNNTSQNIALQYKVYNENRTHNDTLKPQQTDTVACRTSVSGNDVWDIENAPLIFMLPEIEASINDSLFTANARKKEFWTPLKEDKGRGIYELNIIDALFTVRRQAYYYNIENNSGYDFVFQLSLPGYAEKINWQVPDGGTQMLGPYTSKQTYVADLYKADGKDAKPNTNISPIGFSNAMWVKGSDTLYARSFNANRYENWHFEAQKAGNDSVGIYTLNIQPNMIKEQD